MGAGGGSHQTYFREILRFTQIYRDMGAPVSHARESQRRVGGQSWRKITLSRGARKSKQFPYRWGTSHQVGYFSPSGRNWCPLHSRWPPSAPPFSNCGIRHAGHGLPAISIPGASSKQTGVPGGHSRPSFESRAEEHLRRPYPPNRPTRVDGRFGYKSRKVASLEI